MPTLPKLFRACQFCKVTKPREAFQYKTIYCDECRAARGPVKERNREANTRFRERNRERIRLDSLDRYRANPLAAAEKQRKWREKRPERSRSHVKHYRIRHPEMNRIVCANRRVRILGAEGKWTRQEWLDIKARQDHRCLMCGRQEPEIKLTADHVVPLVRGGTNWASNLQGLCQSCNSHKNTKVIDLR